MGVKTQHEIVLENSVAANTTDLTLSEIIPDGVTVTLTNFGGSALLDSDYVALQWGAGGSFTTLRAAYGNCDFYLERQFVGNGAKRFRIVRVNSSPLVARRIFAHLSAVSQDGG